MNKKSDILITLLSKNKKINAYICLVTNTAMKLKEKHNYNIISNAIFSRAVVAGVLLSGNLKNKKDELLLKWKCSGPVDYMVVEINYEGNVRGNINNHNLEYIEGSLVNNSIRAEPYIGLGEIVISRKTYDRRPSYNTLSVIESGEIANDISLLLKQSLQIESALNIGLSIDKDNNIEVCGGILFMAMPDASDKDIKEIYNKFTSINSLTNILKKGKNNNFEDLLKKFNLEVISTREIKFKCNCSKSKIAKLLKSLSAEQFTHFILDNGIINVKCEFCNKGYKFEPKELEKY